MSGVCSDQGLLDLLRFKHSVKDDFEMLSSWVGNDCYMWERIQCDCVTGNVEGLHLRGDMTSVLSIGKDSLVRDGYNLLNDGYFLVRDGFCLVGNEVDSSLAMLRHLKYLDLSGNDFHGSKIPKFIGSLKQLSYLNLSHAGFQGNIPHHIGNLSNLKVLDLSSNEVLISDDMTWTFRLSSLEHLDLSSLNLSGAHNLDMLLYMIPSLKELSLSECELSNTDLGPLLNSSRILPNIKHLDLSFNSFKAPLPGFLQNMTSLAFLDLSGFDLSLAWNFSNLLNMIPSLSELHLSWCGLRKSHLSPAHLNFSTISNIQNLDLSINSIEGMFPSVLTNLSSLRVLDLSRNMLNSSVPNMHNLRELDLFSNRFNQIGHVGIHRHCHLKQLSASHNYFDVETIDSSINVSECSQYSLERLDLSWIIIGTIPEPLERMANLRVLDPSANRLTGPIPKSLRRLRFIEVLDLSNNQLTGTIPTFLGKLSKLYLAFNQLNGSIPESFGRLTTLTDLYLKFNQLTGPIPASLGRLVSLREISVESNLLNGTILVSIGQLAKLHFLDISNNSLEGVVFEAHFSNLSMLKNLFISSKSKLTFNVSPEWIPPFKLVTLQLCFCNITNGFPQWLQNQRNLEMLVLSNATILGPLPTWSLKMPVIPILDLSHNKLSGPLTNLTNGGSFDMSGYRFYQALFFRE